MDNRYITGTTVVNSQGKTLPNVLNHISENEYTACVFALTVYEQLDLALVCFVQKIQEESYSVYWGIYLFDEGELLADPISNFYVNYKFERIDPQDLYNIIKSVTQIVALLLADKRLNPFTIHECTLDIHALLHTSVEKAKYTGMNK